MKETDAIRRAFEKGATHYNEYAVIQKMIANHLVAMIEHESLRNSTILDVGAGTGFVKSALIEYGLNTLDYSLYQTDLAWQMCTLCKSANFSDAIQAEMSVQPFKNQLFELITLCMTLQWSNHHIDVLQEMHRICKPDGSVLIALPTTGSLQELEACFAMNDLPCPINAFPAITDFENALQRSPFQIESLATRSFTETYDSFHTIIKNIRRIGAAHSTQNVSIDWDKTLLNTMNETYHNHFSVRGDMLPVTWHITFARLQR